ncbi:pyrroline-5-carboxylate reductase [Streptococcus macacae]|uniref:Pyrroline-5-carboxylate reductase n=1 Tax=Streptococcus macacae NCTC 11558 TaxID=764298 RepID=G5JWB7_9STRE|nr:pyrroline-5-carboxylate reductase [Streptococcus macacae]EHJ52214.1 pyrroline-5-carboxylate reductase [Streptococcus macacae NCTC 11558]
MKIGFIGVGKMASAIIAGLKQTNFELIISDSSLQKSKEKADTLHVNFAQSHQDLIEKADLIILGLKPQILPSVLNNLNITKPLLSMAAGVSLADLAQLSKADLPIIRIMPNLNAQLLQSSTAICRNKNVTEALFKTAKQITDAFGTTFEIAEKDFHTFTALAGSSPAYIALFIEALTKAGVKHGFSKELSFDIVSQTILATTTYLAQGQDKPNDLIDKVSSPGGTTISGLLELEKTGFTASVISAIDATIDKSEKM